MSTVRNIKHSLCEPHQTTARQATASAMDRRALEVSAPRTYQDEVQEAELARYLEETRGNVRLKPPRLSDADEFLADREQEAKAERRQARRGGRPYQVPDWRDVRGAQYAEIPDVDTQLALLRQGRESLLSPYLSENGVGRNQLLLTTSWVDNVRFDFFISSSGPSISVPRAPASRHVSPAGNFIEGTFAPNGVPTAGGEYAVFAYELRANERIRSAPKQRIQIDVTARYTHNNTTVVKNLRADKLGLVLDMKDIHPILMSNSDNGRPVEAKASRAVVRKSGEQLPFAPTASIFKNPARYTFRYRPSERRWMLTRVDFALARYQLQDIPDSTEYLYFDPTWRVAGEPLDQRQVSVVQTEDPASNPLDPSVYLEVFPLRNDTSFSGLPLLAGQSHRVSMRVTQKLVPKQAVDQTGRAKKTLYVDLPSLEIEIPEAARIIAQAPKTGIGAFRVDVARPEKQARDGFTSSELSLHNAPVSVLLLPSVQPESVYEIIALQIGPIRKSALYEAIEDSRTRI